MSGFSLRQLQFYLTHAAECQVWRPPVLVALMLLLLFLPAGMVLLIPSKILAVLALLVASSVFLWMSRRFRENTAPTFLNIAFLLLAAIVAFANIYYCLLIFSTYPFQHFRLNTQSSVGSATERIYVRRYLTDKLSDYRQLFRGNGIDPSAILHNTEFHWFVKHHLMSMLNPPLPELSEQPDPFKLDELIHQLAIEQELLARLYARGVKISSTVGGKVLEQEVARWFENLPTDRRTIRNFNEIMMVTTAEVLSQLGSQSSRQDARQLFIAALFFSSMMFMTAGYADIVPNSPLAMIAVVLHFFAYVWVFVVLIRRGNGTEARSGD